MPISTKGEYAARAMIHLAISYGRGITAKTREIAKEQDIPKKYLEQILLLFKKEGIVKSKAGLNGGYFLAKPPSDITMAEIVRAVDGPLAPRRCASKTAYTRCITSDEETCALRTVWSEARDALANVLEKITLEEVIMRAEKLSRAETVTYQI
jgi:Rrf2 family protein